MKAMFLCLQECSSRVTRRCRAACSDMLSSVSHLVARWHGIAHLVQPDVQVFLAGHIYGSLKGLCHHQLQQWLMHLCQQLQPTEFINSVLHCHLLQPNNWTIQCFSTECHGTRNHASSLVRCCGQPANQCFIFSSCSQAVQPFYFAYKTSSNLLILFLDLLTRV